jgi:hypothetical protein
MGPLPIPYLMSDLLCIVVMSCVHLALVGRVEKRVTKIQTLGFDSSQHKA